ncbi:flagellar protein FlaH [Halarchaeum rubridurum]|uniref:ATPase n=1 Tax=Halarchaeum rubridurum TaxID=489911 RepID=A0A830G1D4_9EURY|nr:ATPase domain-containing protein [Halarchaeum rubridurum]MBP1954919.1 flagellar protein FlaH [Halarchaeum rubridurum]GGM70369.1 ATPase [Halarchaeum rubridurum]
MTDLYELGLEDSDRVSNAFGGGLPAGSLVLVEGEHGAGKSVLGQRFCYGLCETGTTVTYVSQEETSASFIEQTRSLDYDPVDHLLRERLLFLHANVDTFDAIDEQGDDADGPRRELLTRMMHAGTMWQSDVVVIDGFDAILRSDPQFQRAVEQNREDDVIQNVLSFFRQLLADDKTVVLTVNPDSLSGRALRPLRDTSGVYLQLNTKQVAGDVRREIIVRKFANMGDQVDDSISFDVQVNRGMTIVTRTVA